MSRLLIFLVAFLLVSAAPALAADPIGIGVPEFGRELDYLRSSHPAAVIVRRAVARPLVELVPAGKGETGPRLKLRLGDRFVANENQSVWSLHLSPDAKFSSGRPVQGEDVTFSFELCRRMGLIPDTLSASLREVDRGVRGREEWIDVSVLPGSSKSSTPLEPVGNCPILEKRSGEVFSADIGHGSAMVGCGLYQIAHFQLGRQIVLEKRESVSSIVLARNPDAITIRGFDDLEQGLTSLRLGNIDMLFGPPPDVLEKARKDETLALSRCSGYDVVFRKGLRLDCFPDVDIDVLGYERL